MPDQEIPEVVLESLEDVRTDGEFNMLDYTGVVREIIDRGECWDEDEYREAGRWLLENEGRYMEALKSMSARRIRLSTRLNN